MVIVTHDHAETLGACLAAVEGLVPAPARFVVIDNASVDESPEIAERRAGRLAMTIIAQDQNTGFAAASNRGISVTSEPWVLLLNPDCAPRPDLVRTLLDRVESLSTGIAYRSCQPKAVARRGARISSRSRSSMRRA